VGGPRVDCTIAVHRSTHVLRVRYSRGTSRPKALLNAALAEPDACAPAESVIHEMAIAHALLDDVLVGRRFSGHWHLVTHPRRVVDVIGGLGVKHDLCRRHVRAVRGRLAGLDDSAFGVVAGDFDDTAGGVATVAGRLALETVAPGQAELVVAGNEASERARVAVSEPSSASRPMSNGGTGRWTVRRGRANRGFASACTIGQPYVACPGTSGPRAPNST